MKGRRHHCLLPLLVILSSLVVMSNLSTAEAEVITLTPDTFNDKRQRISRKSEDLVLGAIRSVSSENFTMEDSLVWSKNTKTIHRGQQLSTPETSEGTPNCLHHWAMKLKVSHRLTIALTLIKEKDTAWFVQFCVPWCKHCKNLGSLWEDLGKAMEGEDEIEIGQVDCGTSKPVCQKVDIHSYPTFKLFYNGEEFAKYQGPRNVESLKKFVLEEAEKAATKADLESENEL